MLVVIALLAVLVALRWGRIREQAAAGMRYLRPADSAAVHPPEPESCD